MKENIAPKLISVIINAVILPLEYYLWMFGTLCLSYGPLISPEGDRDSVIYGQDFAAGMLFIAAAVIIPIAANLFLYLLWHRKRGVSRVWTLIPAVAVPLLVVVSSAIMCADRVPLWFTCPWIW